MSQDRERDRERAVPFSPPPRDRVQQPAWRSARELHQLGLPDAVRGAIERWCYQRELSAWPISFTKGRISNIVIMDGDCYFCQRQHSNNHWVLITTPGYDTVRIRCHSTGRVENQFAPFTHDLRELH
jgi:hypothetical protein